LLPALEPVDAVELVRRTLQEAEAAAAQKKIELVLDVADPVWIDADPALLRRVIDNLVANAIAKSPAGSRVRAVVLMREEGGEIAISDEGAGIPEQYRESVFEKYAQVDPKKAGDSSNRGLGLTFCRLAVEAHGGTIWADESPGGGARFRMILPASLVSQKRELAGAGVEA
jgi:signal transduction histidine kinase